MVHQGLNGHGGERERGRVSAQRACAEEPMVDLMIGPQVSPGTEILFLNK